MSKIFIVYSHYDEKSFNNAIKDTFIKEAKEEGHTIDLVDLYKEKFDPVFFILTRSSTTIAKATYRICFTDADTRRNNIFFIHMNIIIFFCH